MEFALNTRPRQFSANETCSQSGLDFLTARSLQSLELVYKPTAIHPDRHTGLLDHHAKVTVFIAAMQRQLVVLVPTILNLALASPTPQQWGTTSGAFAVQNLTAPDYLPGVDPQFQIALQYRDAR